MPSELLLSRAASLFSALANEARLRALVALSRSGRLSVGELLPVCGLEQTALSHQLRTLRTAGLVTAERVGKQVVYALADAHISQLLEVGVQHVSEQKGRGKR